MQQRTWARNEMRWDEVGPVGSASSGTSWSAGGETDGEGGLDSDGASDLFDGEFDPLQALSQMEAGTGASGVQPLQPYQVLAHRRRATVRSPPAAPATASCADPRGQSSTRSHTGRPRFSLSTLDDTAPHLRAADLIRQTGSQAVHCEALCLQSDGAYAISVVIFRISLAWCTTSRSWSRENPAVHCMQQQVEGRTPRRGSGGAGRQSHTRQEVFGAGTEDIAALLGQKRKGGRRQRRSGR